MYNSNLFLDIFQFSPYLLFNIGFALVKVLMFAYHYRNWTPIAIGIRYLSLLPQIPLDKNKLFVWQDTLVLSAELKLAGVHFVQHSPFT